MPIFFTHSDSKPSNMLLLLMGYVLSSFIVVVVNNLKNVHPTHFGLKTKKRMIPQSTGGSTGEDEEELSGTCLETKHNTHHNEFLDQELLEVSAANARFNSLHAQDVLVKREKILEKIRITPI